MSDSYKVYASKEYVDDKIQEAQANPSDSNIDTIVTKLSSRDIVKSEFRRLIDGTLSGHYVNEKLVTVPANFFSECDQLISIELPNATHLLNSTFNKCTKLLNINLPNVVSMGASIFQGCESLEVVSLPNLLEVTGMNLSGHYIKELYLPKLQTLPVGMLGGRTLEIVHLDSLEIITSNNWRGLTSLREVYIPSAKQVDAQAFRGCTGLETFTFYSTPTIDATAFTGCTNLKTIYVPWSEGEVENAPWGAENATIVYNYKVGESS